MPEWQKALALGLATLAVGALLIVFAPRLLGRAGGVEGELITEVKRTESRGFEQHLDGGVLRSKTLNYQRLQVVTEGATSAVLGGTLDFTGTFNDTAVSSLGLERVDFKPVGFNWEPVEGWAPRLAAMLEALEQRRRDIEAGRLGPIDADDAALWLSMQHRRYRVVAWYLRSERERVEVAEDFRLTGETADRPVDQTGTKRLTLVEEGKWFRLAVERD